MKKSEADPPESWWNERPEREERPSQIQQLSRFGGSSQLQPLRSKPEGRFMWIKAILIVCLMVVFVLTMFSMARH